MLVVFVRTCVWATHTCVLIFESAIYAGEIHGVKQSGAWLLFTPPSNNTRIVRFKGLWRTSSCLQFIRLPHGARSTEPSGTTTTRKAGITAQTSRSSRIIFSYTLSSTISPVKPVACLQSLCSLMMARCTIISGRASSTKIQKQLLAHVHEVYDPYVDLEPAPAGAAAEPE